MCLPARCSLLSRLPDDWHLRAVRAFARFASTSALPNLQSFVPAAAKPALFSHLAGKFTSRVSDPAGVADAPLLPYALSVAEVSAAAADGDLADKRACASLQGFGLDGAAPATSPMDDAGSARVQHLARRARDAVETLALALEQGVTPAGSLSLSSTAAGGESGAAAVSWRGLLRDAVARIDSAVA
jgi:hypothetical protein